MTLSKFALQRGLFETALSDMKLLQMNVSRDVSGNPEYIGYSAPGTAVDAVGWLIIKHTYTGSDIDKSRMADDSVGFNKVWDLRAGYAYS